MTTYRVAFQQYVEQVTTVEVEAETREAAIETARAKCDQVEWKPGDDAYDVRCYAVMDGLGNVIWER